MMLTTSPLFTNNTSRNTSRTQRKIPGAFTSDFFDNFTDETLSFKHRVICYLVSHAVACPLPQVRTSILKSLRDVPDESKASMLIPVYKQSFGTSEKVGACADQEYFVALARAIDKNAAKMLNNKEGPLWQVFVEVLQACLTWGEHYAISRSQPH